jgi:hypothetical protein
MVAKKLEQAGTDLLDVIRVGVDRKYRVDDQSAHGNRWVL